MQSRRRPRSLSWRPSLVPERALSGLRSLDAKAMLHLAEETAETTYAVVRLVILIALVVLFLALENVHRHSVLGVASLGLYGIVTVTSLVLAWTRAFRPWLPYALVTLDIVLVGTHLVEMARDLGRPPTAFFGIPASGLLLLILAHATLRFRPALIIYAASLSLLLVVAAGWVPTSDRSTVFEASAVPTVMHTDGVLYWQVLPAAVIALLGFVLWLVSMTTSHLLDRSILYARRAVRLSRFFSPNLIDRLASGSQDQRLAGRRCRAAVVFIDIRGFTSLAERSEPERISTLLSEFRSIVADQVFAHDGTVDKFIGDAVMAVFGTPETRDDDGRRAVRCCIALLGALRDWSVERERRSEESVGVSMGAHYGEVFAGAVGDERLLEFTVLGDTVNVAERLQKMCSNLGRSLVISDALLKMSGTDAAAWDPLPLVRLEGRAQEIAAYAYRDDRR